MAERLTDDQIHHPPNEALLDEATKIKEERALLKERMERLESTRDSVSPAVYQRVRADYVDKINKAMERLLALKHSLEEEQKALLQKRILIEEALRKGKEKLEESALRHALGEFSPTEHETTVREETQETKRLEAALEGIQSGLDRYGKIFEGEEFLKPASRPTPPAPPPQSSPPAPPPAAPRKSVPDVSEPGTMKFREAQLQTDKVAATPPIGAGKIPQLLVMENGKTIQTLTIDHTLQIGRSPANDVVLKEPKVSRKHAEIHIAAGKYILLDLESSNGTFVGGKKITEQVLQADDEIMIGSTKMLFKVS